MIMLPINIDKYHWFLICADLVEDKFYVVDSMRSSTDHSVYVNNFKKFLQDYMRANKGGRMKCEDNLELWRTETPKNVP
jgi:Ulp1 family protease